MGTDMVEQLCEEQLALEGLGLGSRFPINEYGGENQPHDYDPFFDDYD
jgi:hypothetical protein